MVEIRVYCVYPGDLNAPAPAHRHTWPVIRLGVFDSSVRSTSQCRRIYLPILFGVRDTFSVNVNPHSGNCPKYSEQSTRRKAFNNSKHSILFDCIKLFVWNKIPHPRQCEPWALCATAARETQFICSIWAGNGWIRAIHFGCVTSVSGGWRCAFAIAIHHTSIRDHRPHLSIELEVNRTSKQVFYPPILHPRSLSLRCYEGRKANARPAKHWK